MENSGIILMLISCALSFGTGRLFVYFRDKKRKKRSDALEAQTQRDRPVEVLSKNKAKLKRQLQAIQKTSQSDKR